MRGNPADRTLPGPFAVPAAYGAGLLVPRFRHARIRRRPAAFTTVRERCLRLSRRFRPVRRRRSGPGGSWLTAWERAGGDVRLHPRNQRPFVPPPPPTGPGVWVIKVEPMSQNAADHQESATGARWPWVYRYNGKDWDGFEDGHLIDAKDNYRSLVKNGGFLPFIEEKETAVAEIAITKADGYPVRYACSNPVTANAFRTLFKHEQIPVQVVVTA